MVWKIEYQISVSQLFQPDGDGGREVNRGHNQPFFKKEFTTKKEKKNQCLIFLVNIIVWLAAASSAQVAGLFFSILMHQRLERTDRFLWFELLQSCWVGHGFSVMCQSKSNPLEENFFFPTVRGIIELEMMQLICLIYKFTLYFFPHFHAIITTISTTRLMPMPCHFLHERADHQYSNLDKNNQSIFDQITLVYYQTTH